MQGMSLAHAQDSHRKLRVSQRFHCGSVVTVITQLAARISAQLADQQEPLVQHRVMHKPPPDGAPEWKAMM